MTEQDILPSTEQTAAQVVRIAMRTLDLASGDQMWAGRRATDEEVRNSARLGLGEAIELHVMAARQEAIARGGDPLVKLLANLAVIGQYWEIGEDLDDGLVTWLSFHPRWGIIISRGPRGFPENAIELVAVPCNQLDGLLRALPALREQIARLWPDELDP